MIRRGTVRRPAAAEQTERAAQSEAKAMSPGPPAVTDLDSLERIRLHTRKSCNTGWKQWDAALAGMHRWAVHKVPVTPKMLSWLKACLEGQPPRKPPSGHRSASGGSRGFGPRI